LCDYIKEDWMDRTRSINEVIRNAYKVLVGKPQAKKPCRMFGMAGRIILKRLSGKWRVSGPLGTMGFV
jgi:hypothetical protein